MILLNNLIIIEIIFWVWNIWYIKKYVFVIIKNFIVKVIGKIYLWL